MILKKEFYTWIEDNHRVSLKSQSSSSGFRKVMMSITNKLEAKCVLYTDVCVCVCEAVQ